MLTKAGKLALAAAGFAGLTLPHVALFVNDFAPDENSVYDNFNLPTYTGYANAATPLSAVFVDQTGRISAAVEDAVFLGPTAGPGTDVYGWLLIDGTTHDVWACERLDSPPAFLQALLDRLEVDVILHLDGSDTVVVEN